MMSAKNIAIYIVEDLECLKSHFGTYESHSFIQYLKAYILKNVYLPITFNTAVLDMCEDKPGGAVEQREYPAGEDDPLGPSHCADVLKINKNKQLALWLQGIRI